jgi:mannosyltransferase
MKLERSPASKSVLITLWAIVAVGFILRVYQIGKPSLWYDELYTAGRSNYQPAQILADLYENPFPPLYYFGMHYWIKAFGDSATSLRFPSLIFSVLTIIFVFILAKDLFDDKVGLFSALFVSLSGYSIYYAQEAKMYSLLWFLGVISFILFNRFTKEGKNTHLFLYLLFTLISVYTMYIGFIFVIIQNIAYFCLSRGKEKRRWLLGQLAIILLYLPWASRLFYHASRQSPFQAVFKVSNYPRLFATIFSKTLCGVVPRNDIMELSIYLIIILTAFIGFRKNSFKKLKLDLKNSDLVLFLWIIIPFFIYCSINIFVRPMLFKYTERYIGFIYIPLFILIGKGINKYAVKVKYTLLIILLFMSLAFGVMPMYRYDDRVINRENWRAFSRALLQRTENNSLIISSVPLYIITYYVRGVETKPMGYIADLNKQLPDKQPSSIFIVYTFLIKADIPFLRNSLKGYSLKENYYKRPSGFLWFKKIEAMP